ESGAAEYVLAQLRLVAHEVLRRSVAVEALLESAAGHYLGPALHDRDRLHREPQHRPVVLEVMGRLGVAADTEVEAQRKLVEKPALEVIGIRREHQLGKALELP